MYNNFLSEKVMNDTKNLFTFSYKLRWIFITVLVALFSVVWFAVFTEGRQGKLTVAFLDVGQGDAIFIESPTGVQILIDGGAESSVLRELGKVLPFYDRSIDVVLATHPDSDHTGGLIEVLKRYKVDYVMTSGVSGDTSLAEYLSNLVYKNKVKKITALRGQVIDIGAGAYIQILFPDRDVSKVESNTSSIVARLVYGKNKFLLTGDSPKKIEKYIVALDGRSLNSDVLKLGHHGSKTSSSELFLGFVDPKYAIISVAQNSRYGHPHKEVLDKLKRFKIPFLSTAKESTIIFESDGNLLKLVN